MWSETVGLRTNRSQTKKIGLGLGLGRCDLGLGLVTLVLDLVLRIWSCLHHWLRKDRRRKRELTLIPATGG